ncbi:hypothetical protein [Nocardia sp. NPDC057030]|uniref:hypothetical protein n=1 Tax=unclassified Nocardia TaxID=2637762 RepID=UPI00362BB513
MGQYFNPVFLATGSDTITGYVHSRGTKMCEQGWIGVALVTGVERLLIEPTRVVWAGDYADPEPNSSDNLYFLACRKAPQLFDPDHCQPTTPVGRYILNHDQRRYVDKATVPGNDRGDRVHPLVVLTAEGCGLGMGDFGECDDVVGIWARDHISVADTVPAGFDELAFTCIESS